MEAKLKKLILALAVYVLGFSGAVAIEGVKNCLDRIQNPTPAQTVGILECMNENDSVFNNQFHKNHYLKTWSGEQENNCDSDNKEGLVDTFVYFTCKVGHPVVRLGGNTIVVKCSQAADDKNATLICARDPRSKRPLPK